MTKLKIGSKIVITRPESSYGFYEKGSEGKILTTEEVDGRVGHDVKFTKKGWTSIEDQSSKGFWVWEDEFVVVNQKEKEMEKQITLRQGVYAVVETGSKSVVDVFTNRGAARYWMQGMKQEFPECSYKLAKLAVDKWIR